MKGNKFRIGTAFAMIIAISLVLAACAQPVAVAIPDIYDESNMYIPEPEVATADDSALAVTISEESRITLRENVFVGEGDAPSVGGDSLNWYIFSFGWRINSIPMHIAHIVGEEAFVQWTTQFSGQSSDIRRNRREANLITFIEDFNISIEDILRVQEAAFGRPREEIEALISWGRYGIDTGFTDLGNEELWASARFSRSDLDAIFSGDASRIWEAYPGHGVLHNGRVYSPEWIVQNIEAAVNVEQIPREEIERVLDMASDFSYFLGDVVVEAVAAFQAEVSR